MGAVTDAQGLPLPSATVSLSPGGMIISTDDEGSFLLTDLEAGDYDILVTYVGYENLRQKLKLGGEIKTLDLGKLRMRASMRQLDDVYINASRITKDDPISFTRITEDDIEALNNGRDIPYVLRYTPSTVSTSDAGAGVGYTGLRIRGSDATRINVTINGIPLNDSESQAVFWVNLPDLTSSAQNITIQRGLGSSTLGAGAFGATVGIDTRAVQAEPSVQISNTLGSFNTRRHNIELNSGLIADHWNVKARLSRIASDGYIDRATTDLRSYYLEANYISDKHSVSLLHFAGNERTYQSWNGTPEAAVKEDPAGITDYCSRNFLSDDECERLRADGRTYNFYTYDDQVDDYKQDHYQLHHDYFISDQLQLRTSLHLTEGAGFFEQFRGDDDFSTYGLDPITIGGETIESGDFVRRRWLDNIYYGGIVRLQKSATKDAFDIGVAAHAYEGGHFGEITYAEFATSFDKDQRYYESDAVKTDLNAYAKYERRITQRWKAYLDVQYRQVLYEGNGINDDLRIIDFDESFGFFNPKIGVNYQAGLKHGLYAYLGRGHREPDRNDFTEATGDAPRPEQLTNLELGHRYTGERLSLSTNLYLMDYTDQLVLTGALNDVGGGIRSNVADSYRAGIEIEADWHFRANASVGTSLTLSQNRIKQFDEIIFDFISGEEIVIPHEDTDIAYSPSIISSAYINWKPVAGLKLSLLGKYVGDQYLDNTSNENRKLESYLHTDLSAAYDVKITNGVRARLHLQMLNALDQLYSNNGYTFSYGVGEIITENFLYPQAGRHFMLGVDFRWGN